MINTNLQSKLRERFNPDGSDLRIYQNKLLKVLIDFDNFCNRHNIQYWICSGNLIGAVRHGGFIPWDDDVDVDMLNKDYEKFLKAIKNNPLKGYVVQTHKTDNNYFAQYAKFRDINTKIMENNDKDKYYKYRGAYIDIFPLRKSSFKAANFTSKIHSYIIFFSRSNNFFTRKLFTPLLYSLAVYFLYPIIDLFNRKQPNFRGRLGSGIIKERDINDIFPTKQISFEGYFFPAPNDIDAYLTKIYGNYNMLPNLDTITTHITKFITIIEKK